MITQPDSPSESFKIIRFVKHPAGSSLKAFCDVSVCNRVLIRGVRIVEGDDRAFVSMPRQQAKNGKWYDSVVLLSPEDRALLAEAVLEAWKNRGEIEIEGANGS